MEPGSGDDAGLDDLVVIRSTDVPAIIITDEDPGSSLQIFP